MYGFRLPLSSRHPGSQIGSTLLDRDTMSATLLLPSPRLGLVDAPRCCAARWPARKPRRAACCSATQVQGDQQRTQAAVQELLRAIEGTDRGVNTSPEQRQEIFRAIEALEALPASGNGAAERDDSASVSATWKLLWTTEKVLLRKYEDCVLCIHSSESTIGLPLTLEQVLCIRLSFCSADPLPASLRPGAGSYRALLAQPCRIIINRVVSTGDPVHPEAGAVVPHGRRRCLPDHRPGRRDAAERH